MGDKNFKIFGVSYGIIGDLIMGLPVLNYFEKKYPDSYKIWGIEKKCAFTSPLFLNHPLIDKIVISKDWNSFSEKDRYIIDQCQIKCNLANIGPRHTHRDWYNYRNQVEETARIAGVMDLYDVLDNNERQPKLNRWFDIGKDDKSLETHSIENKGDLTDYSNVIGIWPFCSGADWGIRCPSEKWWKIMVNEMISNGYRIFHFGLNSEPVLSEDKNYERYTTIPFFDQIKLSLATKKVICTDSGPSWVISAYDHPCIVTTTNWLPCHVQNFDALVPPNDNTISAFGWKQCDNIKHEEVLRNLQ